MSFAPDIAGLMGAYGAALYSKGQGRRERPQRTVLTGEELRSSARRSTPCSAGAAATTAS